MTILEDIRKPIEGELAAYQRLFDTALTHSDPFLNKALEYIRGRKGKMMRPILVLLTAKECGEVDNCALMSAVTLELLHTASLVHDDVVDESSERRGQQSVNSVYDNKMAVLLGDFLLASSLHAAGETGKLKIVQIISALGGNLAEGEIFQLSNTQREDISEENYYRIIKYKTAALFRACTQLGYLATNGVEHSTNGIEHNANGTDHNTNEVEHNTNGNEHHSAALERFSRLGEIIGIIFQIRDDIFDYFDDAAIGKPRGNDMAEGKLTLPVIHALLTTQDEAMRQVALRVRQHKATPEEIDALIAFTKAHGGIEYAEDEMQRLKREALEFVATFHNAEVKSSLEKYIDFVIERAK